MMCYFAVEVFPQKEDVVKEDSAFCFDTRERICRFHDNQQVSSKIIIKIKS